MKHGLPLFFIFYLALQTVHAAPLPQNIQRHAGNFSLGTKIKYNFMNYGSARTRIFSRTPVFLGLSFSYKDHGVSFSIAQPYTYSKTPGKHAAFDVNMTFYQNRWYEELSVKFYDDFHENDKPFDMVFFSGNLQGSYIFNADNFSLQSAYSMNRIQRSSAGSFIAGGNIRLSWIESRDIKYYNDNNWIINAGPSIGYSHTFVSRNNCFLNMFLLCGADVGINFEKASTLFSPYVIPKLAVGKHNRTWSANFVIEMNFTTFLASARQDYFDHSAATLGFVKRF